jgi:hypothetical protein
MTNQIRISAKNLGQLALPNCCKKCFYLKLKLNFKLPYQIFPGIFSSIDSYSKKITWAYYQKYGRLPDCFSELGNFSRPVKAPSRNQFFMIDEETNIMLTGIVDEILQKDDGSYFIVDYKTSKWTEAQDKLLPMYVAQLNGYALIGEKTGIEPVNGLGLVYYQPETQVDDSNISSAIIDGGFRMPFSAHMLEVELEPEKVVKPLMIEVRRLWGMKEAPEGREGCGDCQKIEELMELIEH